MSLWKEYRWRSIYSVPTYQKLDNAATHPSFVGSFPYCVIDPPNNTATFRRGMSPRFSAIRYVGKLLWWPMKPATPVRLSHEGTLIYCKLSADKNPAVKYNPPPPYFGVADACCTIEIQARYPRKSVAIICSVFLSYFSRIDIIFRRWGHQYIEYWLHKWTGQMKRLDTVAMLSKKIPNPKEIVTFIIEQNNHHLACFYCRRTPVKTQLDCWGGARSQIFLRVRVCLFNCVIIRAYQHALISTRESVDDKPYRFFPRSEKKL